MRTKLSGILKEHFPDSLIYEYQKAFGTDQTIRFIEIFGGTEFKVPTFTEIKRVYHLWEKEYEKAHPLTDLAGEEEKPANPATKDPTPPRRTGP